MRLERCPSCDGHMSFRMAYDCGNPINVYTCESCKYTTFGEIYFFKTSNVTRATTGGSTITNRTETRYEPNNSARKKDNGGSVYIPTHIKGLRY